MNHLITIDIKLIIGVVIFALLGVVLLYIKLSGGDKWKPPHQN
jgi:hypothetical protein